ncbi:Multicopper oxidase with three cupredoxin domains (includes cell division protein FtsP and spore coat protein CotA) [Carboxydocella sporoproducens DSM 16521]|uniref:Multicopper oxidase with three cupredoxin domains (Includes cell division protein FtsP and spore coat protein CotA) n=2 Tax=Carboxydocella TaxID=178898 RepID=A0A1T4PPK2_9FIRM|nr:MULTISPECIES: multicopper oxidase domain-containing protein [Carboxydocella]AVX19703.1 Multicopper oxidase [Carboxydocella thermautotrophica]SJZ93525.1 Multicopper oxidase with three cupredoxin domains (includes cell division protein FtsP and spore coat protein CotA) [Carboxydocella sporoproducens DSM 16521]
MSAPARYYHVVALSVPIVLNRAGEYNPNGMMFVLKEREAELRQQIASNPGQPVSLVQPLVIRACAGEWVEVLLENQLPFPVSMHIQKAAYSIQTSDGSLVGLNQSSLAPPGGSITYRWFCPREGAYLFNDLANPLSSETGSNANGLWGALIVEPPGSRWTDPETGGELPSGTAADIHPPGRPSFREYVVFFHDEFPAVAADGGPIIDPMHPEPVVEVHTISYRSEPSRIRPPRGGCSGEECMMSSWVHGDPATPVFHAYIGDPAVFHLIHAGIKETHVFHLHLYQWHLEPDNPRSPIIDSISISPQETYTFKPLYGAGSLARSFGDAIFHCHLYPHFDNGMWGLWRTHDVLEDGSRFYPDGTPIKALQPLPDRQPPPAPAPERPGFPLFIPGIFGQKPPAPPLGIVGVRDPTPLERAAFAANARPGAVFANPAPPDAPVREYEIVGISRDLVYNQQGWHDPEGRLYVLAEDEEAVLSGQKVPEPLVIRANAGEVVRVKFTNKFPLQLGGNAFQNRHHTTEAGIHIHLVKFDVQCSDGAANGWNYDSSAPYGETIVYQWYCDRELHAVFFHDHQFANLHQQHGVFGALIVEPPHSIYLDPGTGKPLKSGTRAIIHNPFLPDFREFVLFVHDFALLFDREGQPLNPPPFPDSPQDPGVMGINYRCTPFLFRPGDPAYVFSSRVHGEPDTPLLEAYAGDPVRIRLLDGAHEEQHSFIIHGHRWHRQPRDPAPPRTSSQTIGISEAFNFFFTARARQRTDYLYYFGGIDDLWLGLWGIFRVHVRPVAHLHPLPDRQYLPLTAPIRPLPAGPVRRYQVVAMAHPIVYNRFGDHDPNGLLFALARDEAAIRQGTLVPEPLLLRANLGEVVEIHLTNKLPEYLPSATFPEVPLQIPWPASSRVSLHIQTLTYLGPEQDGAAVGFNPDSTIPPGASRLYRFQADVPGLHFFYSMTDLRNHRQRGLFGAIIVEPPGSYWLDPYSGKPRSHGAHLLIYPPGQPPYREFAVIAHNGIELFDQQGQRIPDPQEVEDFEDQGHKAFNYRSERLANRLAFNPDPALVFSSAVHGDPATPLFEAYTGEPLVFHFGMAASKPRNTSFLIHGHTWTLGTSIIACQGKVSIGNSWTLYLREKAGGRFRVPGDYLYRAGVLRWDVEAGMWGILRVHAEKKKNLLKLK